MDPRFNITVVPNHFIVRLDSWALYLPLDLPLVPDIPFCNVENSFLYRRTVHEMFTRVYVIATTAPYAFKLE